MESILTQFVMVPRTSIADRNSMAGATASMATPISWWRFAFQEDDGRAEKGMKRR